MLLHSFYRNVRFRANQLFIACLCLLRGAFAYLNFRSPKPEQNDEMPQEMNVLCCFSCSMYQVHIVKKSNKWQCKICGEKQSIQVVYFQGSGSDCRKQVQHLNSLKGEKENQQAFHSASIQEYGLDCLADECDENVPCNCPTRVKRSAGKWAEYLENEDSSSESSEEKENLSSSQENAQRCRKQEEKRKQSCSLPPTHNSSKMQSDSMEWSYEPKAGSSRSRTYPLVDRSLRIPNKWDKYLDGEREGSAGKANPTQNEMPGKDSPPSSSPSKNNIFEDSNDDLDVTIDF